MEPVRTDLAASTRHLVAAMVTNYQCGSCGGQVETLITDDATDSLRAHIRHDDNCPTLNGHVSSLGDLARAAAGHIPDTFRP